MTTIRTGTVLLCAVLAASMDSPTGKGEGKGGYPAGAPLATAEEVPLAVLPLSPTGALSPGAAQRLAEASPTSPSKPFTAYGEEPTECTLSSSEGTEVTMSRAFAKQSTLLKNMLEDNTNEIMPLPNVKAAILEKVISYMNYHGENPEVSTEIQKPLKSTNLGECGVAEWDVAFVDSNSLPQEQLFEVILAANYMDVKTLLDLACAKVASMIKGKNTEEIRQQFNIVNDFTPEEQAQVEEESRWHAEE